VWQDELLRSSLLEISEFLYFGGDERSSICNPLDVIGCSNGTPTAAINELDTTSFDLA